MNEDADIQKVLSSVVLYKIDAEKDEHGPEYAKQQSVRGYPTFIAVNAKGEPINRWMGYTKPLFTNSVAATLADLTTIDEKRARLASQPSEPDAALLARYAESRGEYQDAVKLYQRAGELAGPQGPGHAMDVFNSVYRGSREKTPVFTMDEVRQAAARVLDSKSATPSEVIALALRMSAVADREKDPALKLPYLRAAEERSRESQDPEVIEARKDIMPVYALLVDKDEARAVEYKKASLPEGWMSDATHLNDFAWWCFEHQVNRSEARTLAEKGVSLAAPGKEKAMILDTLAELCNSLEDCRQAIELERQAVTEDPENQFYKEQIARFEKILANQG